MATMYVTEPGARIEKEYRRILVTKHDQTLKVAPLARLTEVVLVGRGVGATTPALHSLLEAGVGLTFVSRTGKLLGRLVPPMPKNVPARQAQYARAQYPAFCLCLSRAIVAGKLRNSRVMARRVVRDRADVAPATTEADIDEITRCLKAVPRARTLNVVRGLEGRAARVYFRVWKRAFRGALVFERRTRRPPQDPINALLGLGYSLLTQNLMTACEIVGMDPYDGFLHADKHGRPALALDLVEEFRAIVVDSLVRMLVNKRLLDTDDFRYPSSSGGGVYLNRRGLRVFFTQYSRRLSARVLHPYHQRRLTYQQCFEVQARLLRKTIEGELDTYPPFVVK